MCTNAMKYNHVDTIYYKASKKLLHAGSKIMQHDKLGWVLNLIPELTSDDMGFEITPELRQNKGGHEDHEDSDHVNEGKKKMPATKFEAIQDDLTPEEILSKSQIAAREARVKLIARRGPSMGFLKQRKDGTTNINILVGGEGVIPGTKKRPVLLGQLCGKLTEGTGQIQGFREDRRNITKPVKPLYYGAFGSYAPSYDSAFANLSKEESDMVYQTYGSDTAVQYAESVLDFVKDSDYATHLVDSLLDLLTGGDHSKTRRILEENKKLREEEEAVKTMLEVKPIDAVKVDVDELRSLQDVGIDINFLDNMEEEIKLSEERHELQQRLDSMCQLLQKLQQSQHQRLSAPPPVHLSQCVPPSEEEMQVAENITENLTEIAKRVNPGDVAPVTGIRKALGVALPEVEVSNEVADLETELRQFLESEPALTQSPLRDDKTIEEILME
jgi:bromodomain-containing protein 7/9